MNAGTPSNARPPGQRANMGDHQQGPGPGTGLIQSGTGLIQYG
jgi:hypothetical protein